MRSFKTGTIGISKPNNKEIFDKYISEISKFKPLSREQEVKLFKKIKAGNKEAREIIFKHNLLFVLSVAKKYSNSFSSNKLTLEDLINEGNIGLYDSIDTFDYKTGNKFISYAVWKIRANILAFIQDNVKSIRLPRNATTLVNKIIREENNLEQKIERTPTIEETFNSMIKKRQITNLTKINSLVEVKKMYRFEKSLSDVVGDDDGLELGELIKSDDLSPDSILIEKEKKELCMKMIEGFPEKIQNYFIDYFGLNGAKVLNLTKMGLKYDEIPETIRQRILRAIRKIKLKNRYNREFYYNK